MVISAASLPSQTPESFHALAMTERDLVEAMFAIFDRYWNIIQWWGSVSFGLIAVAHFAVEKLNFYLLMLLIMLYGLFSGWVVLEYFFNVQILWGFHQDLVELGPLAHHGSRALIESMTVLKGVILQDVAVVLTFCGCNAYLIYSYLTRRSA